MKFGVFKKTSSLGLIVLLALFTPSSLIAEGGKVAEAANEAAKAEEAKPAKVDNEKVLPSVVSSFGKRGGNASVEFGVEADSKFKSPIGGSIKPLGGGRCEVSIFNASKEHGYSVRYSVQGTKANGGKVSKKTMSARLAKGGIRTRNISCPDGASMEMAVVSGSRL